jgi:Protein of unknown function (DUF2793)
MPDFTPSLALPYLLASQADKHVSVNTAFQRLDMLTQCAVESRRVSVEPATPNENQTWILPSSTTGANWPSLPAFSLVRFSTGVWTAITPVAGYRAFVIDEARSYLFDGTTWNAETNPTDPDSRLINATLQIWQRGNSFTTIAPNEFGPDRWRAIHTSVGSPQINWNRTILQPVAQLPAQCANGLRADVVVAGTAPLGLEQAMEDARTLSGRWVCLSFYARASAALVVSPVCEQRFGTGGSATVTTPMPTTTVTTSWTRVETSVFLPSTVGKTIGAGSALALRLTYPAVTGAWLEITGIQLEAGKSATALAGFSEATELTLCRRHFFSTLIGRKPASAQGIEGALLQPRIAAGSYFHRMSFRFPTRMRAIPVLTFYNPLTAGGQCSDVDVGVDCTGTAPLSFGQSADQAVIFTQTPASGLPGNMLALHVVASAEL